MRLIDSLPETTVQRYTIEANFHKIGAEPIFRNDFGNFVDIPLAHDVIEWNNEYSMNEPGVFDCENRSICQFFRFSECDPPTSCFMNAESQVEQ
jgi:hypothetical protein